MRIGFNVFGVPVTIIDTSIEEIVTSTEDDDEKLPALPDLQYMKRLKEKGESNQDE